MVYDDSHMKCMLSSGTVISLFFRTLGGKVDRIYKKPTATKLRHFAKATSPDSTYRQLLLNCRQQTQTENTSKPSLIVSIPLSMLRQSNKHTVPHKDTVPHKARRVTLSSFVTKKRANSRTPSTSSDSSYEPPGLKRIRTKSTATRGQGRSVPRGGKSVGVKVIAARSRRTCSVSDATGVGVEPITTVPTLKGTSTAHLERGNNVLLEGSKVSVNGKPKVLQAHMHRGSLDNGISSLQDDDQLSIASASTNSTTNGSNGRVRSRSTSKARKDMTAPKPTFSFEELFSFYPPKLVLIDDELQPEQSLSVKDYDRHALPESHPFWKWTFGQPVKGMTTTKKKRKVMVNGNGS